MSFQIILTTEFGKITHSLSVFEIHFNLSQKLTQIANCDISLTLHCFHSIINKIFLSLEINAFFSSLNTELNDFISIFSQIFQLYQYQSSHLKTNFHSILGIFSIALSNFKTRFLDASIFSLVILSKTFLSHLIKAFKLR